MKIDVRMAIMSHLSDAQEALNMGLTNRVINNEINFAKRLLMKYKDNINVEVEETELDDFWREVLKNS